MAVSFQFCLNAILKRLFWIYYHCIEIPRIYISHDLLWFIGFSPPSTQSALGRVWGYSKRKTDPIFEIPTVENHRIDVSHDFLHVFFNFCRYGGAGGNGDGRNGKIASFRCSSTKKEPPYQKSAQSIYNCGQSRLNAILGTSAPNVS